MAAIATLLSSMSSLALDPNSFLGQRVSRNSSPFTLPVGNANKRSAIVMRMRPWERAECKPNSLPILYKMHVKIGDTVKIISGRDKGKIGEIVKIDKKTSKVIVKDINMKTKHRKSTQKGEPGQIVKMEAPIHSSNVMLYSKEQNVASRVGHKILEDGSRVRYLIKTGEVIDSADKWKKLFKEKQNQKEKKSLA